MKAYLKGSDGTLFNLQEVTSVGGGKCDIVLQRPGVDVQHCKISYSEHDSCYILQDMNTNQGTYVNEVRVQNAAVRLAAGDLIRFGYSGQSYELVLENDPQVNATYMCHKSPAWSEPQTLPPNDEPPISYISGGVQGFPHIANATSFSHTPATWLPTYTPPPVPRPPLRSRPSSAGAARKNVQNLSACTSCSGAWVRPANQTMARTSSIPNLQDKDKKISQLNQEVTKLRNVELEMMYKDTIIQQLKEELDELQNKIDQDPSYILGVDKGMSARLLYLETEVCVKKEEINTLKEQINRLQDDKAPVTQELSERVKEVSQLRTELDRTKKDKSITAGLITQMQREISNKDNVINRLNREIEVQKKEIRERDAQIFSVKHAKEVAKPTDENTAREKEMNALKKKCNVAENKIKQHLDTIAALHAEAEKAKSQLLSEKDKIQKLQNDLDGVKTQLQDFHRSERVVRMDLEQIQKKNERLRSKVVQLIFSTSDMKPPQKEISDDELIESLLKLSDERTKLLINIKDLESDLTSAKNGKCELLNCAERLREALELSANRLKKNGRQSSHIKEELTIIQSLRVDDNFAWMQDLFTEVLTAELAWENLTEEALTKCGASFENSNKDPSQHIQMLYTKWEASITEMEQLQKKIQILESEHTANLELKLKSQKIELEERMRNAVEETKFRGEQELKAAINEEKEQKERCVEAERVKVKNLESELEELRKSFNKMSMENNEKLTETSRLLQELEALKVTEKQLKENVEKFEQQLIDRAVEREDLVKNFESEKSTYEEQIKQHSTTICAMEEKLTKLMKEKKSIQDQLNKLKSKPAVPPKFLIQKPQTEMSPLEHIVKVLRQENTVLKKDIRDSQDIIIGLRRDLAGAAAQLSDISGEMSESHKLEVERSRELLNQKGEELSDLRKQMAKLSKIIDSQKEEIQKLEENLSKEKTIANRYKCHLEDNNNHIEKLKDELQKEKVEQKKQLELIESEGRITSELTSLGAQCRGERHEHVIARQQEALAELRTKIRILEQTKTTLSTEDDALKMIMHLQKELAEVRKNQALAENMYIQESTFKEKGRSKGLSGNAEAEMERGAHIETIDALERSEASYLSLVRCLADALNIDGIGGMSSVAHIPKDERELVIKARREACLLLTNHIESLRERLAKKDELLEDYESQLAQLKTSMILEKQRSQDVENLKDSVRSRAEETEYLRESLNRARDKLNHEKKLNSLIKDRKLHRHHHCKMEDLQEEVRKKQVSELVKRKNYEIKKLKKVLCDTERVLHDSHRAQNWEVDTIPHSQKCNPSCSGCPECRGLKAISGAA